jgi:hypothetical protein
MTTATITDWVRATRCPGSYVEVEMTDVAPDELSPGRVHGNIVCPECGRSTRLNSFKTLNHVAGHADSDARPADLLRAAAQHSINGGRGPVSMLYLGHTADAGGLYWARQQAITAFEGLDDLGLANLMVLLGRYKRYYRLATEVWPGWVEWNRTYWADNSVESNQVATDGSEHTRRVTVTAPHGDACF